MLIQINDFHICFLVFNNDNYRVVSFYIFMISV